MSVCFRYSTAVANVTSLGQQVPADLLLGLLEDDLARDIVTARRAALLAILWRESHLSSSGLMAN